MDAHMGAHAPAHLRLLSFAVAALVCGALAYMALTGKFSVIAELMDDAPIVDSFTIPKEEPAPPPPRPIERDPPPLQHVERDTEAPPTFDPIPYEEVAEPRPLEPAILTGARFLERPSGRDFARYYPDRALERGQSGRVVLSCLVAAEGRMTCRVASEDPPGWGFGEASLRAARHFRVAAITADGRPTSGGVLSVPMTWRAE